MFVSLLEGQTETASDCFDSAGQPEEFQLKKLLQEGNGKRDLDLVFDFYGPPQQLSLV
jgi:hypothetical protein